MLTMENSRAWPALNDSQTSDVPGPRRRAQTPGRLPQQKRNWQSDAQHHEAEKTQARAEAESHALDGGEPSEDGRSLLFERRTTLPTLHEVVGDALRSFGHRRTIRAE